MERKVSYDLMREFPNEFQTWELVMVNAVQQVRNKNVCLSAENGISTLNNQDVLQLKTGMNLRPCMYLFCPLSCEWIYCVAHTAAFHW